MKVLVTGATGFIGYEFVKILQNDYEISVLVRESSSISKLFNLNCKIYKFENHMQIESIFREGNFDGVVHFASNISVDHSLKDIPSMINSNIIFGMFLLEASQKNQIKWFINTGTFWQNYNDNEYNPVNLYAATKEAFIDIAKYYTEVSNMMFLTIKLNDTFGANDIRPKVFNLWSNIGGTGEVINMSKGEQIIDISYIEDVISAYKTLIEQLSIKNIKICNNSTFVVSNKEKVSLKGLSKIFELVTNQKLNINWGKIEYREREVMMPYYSGEPIPGWKQKYTLKDAIKKTIEGYSYE